MDINFVEQARSYLESTKGSWRAVSEATGIKHAWICRVMDERIKDPGASKVEKILRHAYETGWRPKESDADRKCA